MSKENKKKKKKLKAQILYKLFTLFFYLFPYRINLFYAIIFCFLFYHFISFDYVLLLMTKNFLFFFFNKETYIFSDKYHKSSEVKLSYFTKIKTKINNNEYRKKCICLRRRKKK